MESVEQICIVKLILGSLSSPVFAVVHTSIKTVKLMIKAAQK